MRGDRQCQNRAAADGAGQAWGRRNDRAKGDAFDGGRGQAEGFDDFELRLGDVMRGERATLGKSLLDVQRELKIKAAYIAAIENCDRLRLRHAGLHRGLRALLCALPRMDPDWPVRSASAPKAASRPPHGMSAGRLRPSASRSATPMATRPEPRPFANPHALRAARASRCSAGSSRARSARCWCWSR